MIIEFSNDGKECNIKDLHAKGFCIDPNRDVNGSFQDDDDNLQENKLTFNFVGFITNKNNDIMLLAPKGYKIVSLDNDAQIIFSVIQKHMQKNPDLYVGDIYGEKYVSSYPFASFWGIYNYFIKFGLYHNSIKKMKYNINGKIDWKTTIKKTNFYIKENNLLMFPFYRSKKYNLTTLITECMIFAIDYTIDKFSNILNAHKTGYNLPENDFICNKEKITRVLEDTKNLIFNDKTLQLLDNLIDFFKNLNLGGNYYFKTYVFEYIWEDMISQYLNKHFEKIIGNNLIFSKDSILNKNFKKIAFYPNMANKKHSIEPDFYYSELDNQYIFDAKYKKYINGIDYKQVCYLMFLSEKKDEKLSKQYKNTYSALIIPDDYTHSNIHFQIDPSFNDSFCNLYIIEQYLNIREIMQWYIDF